MTKMIEKEKTKTKNNKIVLISVASVLVFVVVVIAVLGLLSVKPKTAVCGTKEYSVVVQSDDDAKKFVEQFYDVDQLYSLQQEYVPIEFNDTYSEYNELQKMQGLDLEDYKGAKCKLYIYKLSDNEINGKATYMSMLVYEERVIGGHVSTMIKDSPMYTFDGEKYE